MEATESFFEENKNTHKARSKEEKVGVGFSPVYPILYLLDCL